MTSITIVDPFEVSGEEIEQAIALWDTFQDYISTQKGFISARLLQSHNPESKFNIVIISEWESKESYDASISSPNHTKVGTLPDFIRHRASYYTVRNA